MTLGVNLAPFERGLNAAAARFRQFGATLAGVGASISAAGAAVVAPFLQGLSVFSEFGTEMVATMRMTGIEFSQLDEIMDGTRVSAETLVPAIAKMSATINEAGQGGREANEALERMGISLEEIQGMSQGERFLRVADGLNSIADAGQRIAAQRQILGRGGLGIDVSGGAAGVRARAARQDEVEGVQTPEDLAAARAYNLAMREMKLAISGVWFAIGRTAAPLMTEFTQLVVRIVIHIRQWIEENRYLLDILFRVADKVVAVGFVVVGFAGIAYAASVALSVLSFAIKATGIALIAKAAGLVIAKVAVWAYTAAVSAAAFITSILTGSIVVLLGVLGGFVVAAALAAGAGLLIYANWDTFVTFMSEWIPILERFGATMAQMFRGIGDAIVAADWVLALQIAWAGIQLVWTRGVNFLLSGWDSFTLIVANTFLDVVDSISVAFRQMINAVIDGLNGVIERYNQVRGILPAVDYLDFIDENAGVDWNEQMRRLMGNDFQDAEMARSAEERRLQGELDFRTAEADTARLVAQMGGEIASPGGGGDIAGGAKAKILGGFSAGALFGLLGTGQSRGESLQERIARANQEQVRLLVRAVDQLNEITERVAATFG